MTALTILMFVLAYLIGSISSAILVCRLFKLGDPRAQGSGNPGATNVFRLGGKLPAVLVLLFDVIKGTLPVWTSHYLGLPPIYLAFVAITACLGHMYPIFFQFKGGKAVATAFGAVLPLGLTIFSLLLATWTGILILSGYSSLASIITFSLAPLFTWLVRPDYAMPVAILSALIIFRHRQNIVRLYKGTETKIRNKPPLK